MISSDEIQIDWNKPEPKGLSPEFGELNKILQTLPGMLIAVLGSGTSGKTTLLQQIALSTSRIQNRRWLWFSPEKEMLQNFREMERMIGGHRAFLEFSQVFIEPQGATLATKSLFDISPTKENRRC